jgi:nitrite reductase (NADH) large subunit
MFTEEAYPFYYRVRFPELVAGEVTVENITIHPKDLYQGKGISLHLEEPIREVQPEKRDSLGFRHSSQRHLWGVF